MRILALAAAFFALLAPAVRAEDDAETRKKALELIEELATGSDWQKRQKLVISLRRAPGAVGILIEECCARGDLSEKGWQLAGGLQPVLEARRAEAVEPIRKLLKEADDNKARFGVLICEQAGLVGPMAADLIALFPRQDSGVGSQAISVFGTCRDPRAVELLVAETGKGGVAMRAAVSALAYTGAEAARETLRKIASDTNVDGDVRSNALNGLSRNPAAADVELAVTLLKTGDDNMIGAAVNLLLENRIAAPVDVLKAAKKEGNNWLNDPIDRLLSLAGDLDAAKQCLRKAKGGQAYEKGEWYVAAGRSGRKELKDDLEKAFGSETDDNVRFAVLTAIGELGDPASIDLIAKYLTHPDLGWQAMRAMCALARRTPESLDAVLDRIVDLTGVATMGIDSFHYQYLEKPTAADRVRLIEAYLKLLDRMQERPRIRGLVLSALTDMTRPDFGQSEEAVGKWKSWWAENKEAFGKRPPKGQ
ncbi:MAG: hypothetical protein HYY18_14060 [Planctomycetes bacterium]|nr:hypothetical protein [Planctomycetota bacterium]